MRAEFIHLVVDYWPAFMAIVGWPVVSAIINVMLMKHSAPEWEAWAMKHPTLALVESVVFRASGWNVTKILPALKDYADRKSGRLPANAPPVMARLPKVLLEALQDPELMRKIEVEAAKIVLGHAEERAKKDQP